MSNGVNENMRKFTKKEAIAYAESEAWRELTHRQRAELQLAVEILCMPFPVFHEAIESALGRTVYTHEMAGHENWDRLKAELAGDAEPPTMDDILGLLPRDKPILTIIPASTKQTPQWDRECPDCHAALCPDCDGCERPETLMSVCSQPPCQCS